MIAGIDRDFPAGTAMDCNHREVISATVALPLKARGRAICAPGGDGRREISREYLTPVARFGRAYIATDIVPGCCCQTFRILLPNLSLPVPRRSVADSGEAQSLFDIVNRNCGTGRGRLTGLSRIPNLTCERLIPYTDEVSPVRPCFSSCFSARIRSGPDCSRSKRAVHPAKFFRPLILALMAGETLFPFRCHGPAKIHPLSPFLG